MPGWQILWGSAAETSWMDNIVKLKYLIVEHDKGETALVFSPSLLHDDIARGRKVTSAGFCKLGVDGKWIAVGTLASLNCSARLKDAEILNQLLSAGDLERVNQPSQPGPAALRHL